MASEKPAPRFFLLLIAASVVLLAMVMMPIISELFLAAVLAGVLWPLQRWLARRLRQRGLAAVLMTVAVVLLLVGPVATIGAFIIRDGSDAVKFLSDALHSEDVARMVNHLPEASRDMVNDALERAPRDLGDALGNVDAKGKQAAAEAVGAAVAATGSVAFHTVLMFIALFFLLVRGDELVRWLDTVSPLGPGHTQELLTTFKKVSYAVVVSAFVTAAIQALAALAGYMIARVPSPIFFALITFFFAFIPAIGAGVVCLVAALLILVTGHPYMALFLAVWGVAVVGLVDNLAKPLLVRRGLEIHGGVVFFALIGGIAAFGAIGLLIGPLVVAMFLALLRIYHRDFTPADARVPAVPGLPGGRREDGQVEDRGGRPR